MSSSDRRAFLTFGLSALALAGCGYAPALAPGGVAGPLYGRIYVTDPTDENGYRFVNRFEQRLGQAEAPSFDLAYMIKTSEQGLAITNTQETTRFNIVGSVTYSLTDRRTGTVLMTGEVNSFTGYSATGTTVSTRTAQQDAQARLMVILADQLATKLIGSAGALDL